MKNFLPLLFFLTFGLFTLNSCQPKEDALPAPTTEGLNTFGCKINGKVWIANGIRNDQGTAAKAIEVEFKQLSATTFYLFIHTNASTKDRVQLTLPKGVVGTNLLEDTYDKPFGIYYDNNFKIFNTKSSNPGQVVISRLDTVSRIVSGRFAFDAEYIVTKETVKVTEGRFDVKYE
ncbi:DUF6252 family protein [Runella zeae]|uniref:DUF6252 family protein n=1 Tax=Runella zeae TaxID=94255 RepID=UPI0004000C16|nr:DUF6252 family protein [Runella zeae]